MAETVMEKWHRMLKSGERTLLDELLDDNAVFHSPVVHTPQRGKEIVKLYLGGASKVFGEAKFKYLREVESGNNCVLEFEAEIDGIYINGIDMIQWNDQGKITDFKVMIRPLKAVNMVHQKMMAMLEKLKGA